MFSCNERKSLLQKSVRKSPWPKNKNTSMRISSETGWALCRPPWPRGPRAAVRTLHCHEPTVTQLQERLSKEEKHKSNCYLHHGSRKKKKKESLSNSAKQLACGSELAASTVRLCGGRQTRFITTFKFKIIHWNGLVSFSEDYRLSYWCLSRIEWARSFPSNIQ